MELFKILGRVAIDSDIAKKELDDTSGKAEATHSRMSAAFNKIGSAAAVCGKAIAAGLAAGATAMSALTMKALNAAGDLEQNMGGSEAVFGEYASRMQQTAGQAFSNMGLSASDFLATANKMGALFQGAGFGIEESANVSAAAMQRAADVASIMGISTESAMESIAGAAKGNFTMMDNLGVAMNETTLEAYALEKGMNKAYNQMTQSEKIGVAMEMFLEKTAYAAGNYAKENETLAGSLGTAKAALTNFLSGAGDVDSLVGALVNAADVIIENIQVILPRLVEGLNQLLTSLLPYVAPMMEELLPGIIEGAMILVTGLITALPQILEILLSQLPFILSQIGEALIVAFPLLLETVQMLFGQIWDYIAVELLGTTANFEESFLKIQEFFTGLWEALQVVWQEVGQPIWTLIQECIGIVSSVFAEKMPEIKEFVSSCFSDIQIFWENNLKPCLDAIGNFIQNVLAPIFKAVFETSIKGTIENVFNTIKGLWNNTLKPIFTGITDFLTGVFTGNWQQAWNGVVNIFKGIINLVPAAVESAINGAISMINGLISGVNTVAGMLGLGQIRLIGNVTLPRLEEGGVLEKGQVGILEGNGAEAVVPLDQNKAWISAVAKDMHNIMGGTAADNERLQKIIDLLEMLIDMLPDTMIEAFAAMKFDINNREFGRLVKAVN